MRNKISWIKFIFSRLFLKQVTLAMFCVIITLLLALLYLNIYTKHNENILLPDYTGKHIDYVDSLIDAESLRYIIIDSIFNKHKKPGTVIHQDPSFGIGVKENRRIYLSIVAKHQQKIIMPSLIDLTHRSAIEKIQSLGFEVGALSYVPNLAKNGVLKQKINGVDAIIGKEYPVGTEIDLILGNGLSNVEVELPILNGLTYEEAGIVLKLNSLNIGMVIFDTDVLDTVTAIIYDQRPTWKEGRMIRLGRPVDVFLKNN